MAKEDEMKRSFAPTLALLVLISGLAQNPAPAQPLAQSPTSIDYANDANWLCLPGRVDPCSQSLPTALLEPNGYGPVTQAVPAANPAADCFYVYPAVSRDPEMNSDMMAGIEEQGAARVQFAPFGSVCRSFAPVYRSATIRAIGAALAGQDPRPIFDLAYRDVLAAWRDFLRNRNRGRFSC
jgi:hypothetical protein